MSQVVLLAADKPLPLYSRREMRTSVETVGDETFTISCESGFRVSEHHYYRRATDELGYPIKPYQYELSLERNEAGLRDLRAYLTRHFTPGEEVELWSIWLDNGLGRRPPHFCGSLADFDMDTLEQLLPPHKPGMCWLTITT